MTLLTREINSKINVRLPATPETKDKNEFNQLIVVYNAIKQLQSGVDTFLDIPPTVVTEPYEVQISDRGNSIDTTADVTIPSQDVAGFEYGNTIVITNIGNSEISIIGADGVQLITAAVATVGNKKLSAFGVATARYLGSDIWLLLGTGMSDV